ncbi:hypothetical protein BDV25DRAFT_141626 [Aspergillus avenaceus]|uniref:Uncharacterized protein n=1 Tax=Aspergillus avenaceus TaxID=36643 RepID=A0A5N6TQK5_ASPAV|nr:hypothetical protein BDV25DRAFT_141626 [Aspergillus avenaceus]
MSDINLGPYGNPPDEATQPPAPQRLRLPRTAAFLTFLNEIFSTWISTFVGICFANLCFVLAIVILWKYHKKTPPTNLPLDLQVTDMTSHLLTVAMSLHAWALAGTIGQWKYVVLAKEKIKLSTFFTIHGATIATVCAYISRYTASHMVGIKPTSMSIGSVVVAVGVSVPATWFTSGYFQVALKAGFWENQPLIASLTCPTGNCTYDPYDSPGFCARCDDVTSSVELVGCDDVLSQLALAPRNSIECKVYLDGEFVDAFHVTSSSSNNQAQTITLPEKISTQIWYLDTNIQGSAHPIDTQPTELMAFLEIVLNVDDFTTATTKNITLKKAEKCIISPCSRSNDQRYCWKPKPGRSVDNIEETHNNSREISLCPEGCQIYNLDYEFDIFRFKQNVNFTKTDNATAWTRETPNTSPYTDEYRTIELGLKDLVNNIASSLTKSFIKHSNSTVAGKAWSERFYIVVAWPWLALPTVPVVLGTVFGIYTIWESIRLGLPAWKASVEAIFYLKVGSSVFRNEDRIPNTLSEVNELSHELEAQLLPDSQTQTWRLQ